MNEHCMYHILANTVTRHGVKTVMIETNFVQARSQKELKNNIQYQELHGLIFFPNSIHIHVKEI
jgi:hypothetical protein